MEEVRSSIEDATTSLGTAIEKGLGIARREGKNEEEEAQSRAGDESPKRGKLLFGVANVGGSLTVLLRIALFAWGVRQLRSFMNNRRQRREDARAAAPRPVDRVPFALLSPVAVKRLVELDPVRHVFVDVRFPAAVKDSPAPFESVLNIPEAELSESLQLGEEWEVRYPSVRKIGQTDLIVFLSTKGQRAENAAKVAAGLGYSGCCILSGGLEAFAAAMSNYVDVPLKFLSRHAVATILEKQHKSETTAESGSSSVYLLDVRRPDELEHFGHIDGSQNIPVTELPKALTLDRVGWEESYKFPKFSEDDKVIFQCRVHGRAAWGAQLAQDAGLKQCFVYKDGALGWRLDPSVKPYHAYKFGDPIPDPIQFEVEAVDHEAARDELQQLGLG